MHSQDSEHLKHDHAELGDVLSQLTAAFDANEIASAHATLDLFWARLAVHIRAEHLHLFPAISQAAKRTRDAHESETPSSSDAEAIIEELREDHDFFMRELAQAIAVMRDFSTKPNIDVSGELEDVRRRVDAVQQRLVKHNEIEENGIYVWTKTLLSEAEQAELAGLVKKELQNMPPRFGVKG